MSSLGEPHGRIRSAAIVAGVLVACATPAWGDAGAPPAAAAAPPAQVGARPYYLIAEMDPGPLAEALAACAEGPFARSDFSIGHRGAPLSFPEHTRESYAAAARQGAGLIECDVTFTKDLELVCRHAQCDLHTTTDILLTELAERCRRPFRPADPARGVEASARCCASDVTLAEFKTLCGRMGTSNPDAATVEEFLGGGEGWSARLSESCGTLLSHKESIELLRSLGVGFTPELKTPAVDMPFKGLTQEAYAQKLIDEYVAAGVDPSRVWVQSFDPDDVQHWIQENPAFGRQAVYLDARHDLGLDPMDPSTWSPTMEEIKAAGVNIVAPPMWVLVTTDADGDIVPSAYAKAARSAGLDIITWTFERSGPLRDGGGWYYQSVASAIDDDGDAMVLLDVLARKVGVIGVFSDWPGTVTYYANCMGL